MKNILILHNSALGDFITFIPFLRLLNYNFPEYQIDIFTKKDYFPILEKTSLKCLSFFNIESYKIFELYKTNFYYSKNFFQKNYDKIISFIGFYDENFKKNLKKICKNSFFIFPHNKFSSLHNSLFLIKSFKFKMYKFFYPDLKINNNPKNIIIHPGSGNEFKNMPIYFFKNLAKKLEKTLKLKIIFIGGEAEKNLKNKITIKILNSIDEAFEIFKNTYFYIGNDSGISHLAAALNIPTFTFFGPTSPTTWAPIGNFSYIFWKNLSCSPCKNYTCQNKECLNFELKDILNFILYKIN